MQQGSGLATSESPQLQSMYDDLVHRPYFDVEWTDSYRCVSMQVLKVFKFPITCTQVQLGVGVVWALLMWATGLHKKPKVSKEQVTAHRIKLPAAVASTFQNIDLKLLGINQDNCPTCSMSCACLGSVVTRRTGSCSQHSVMSRLAENGSCSSFYVR